MSSTVQVGAPADTGPTFTLTITRLAEDEITDWTTATQVVLVLPDASTKTVTKVSAFPGQWIGRIQYNAWFATAGEYKTRARASFPGSVFTVPTDIIFEVG